MEKQLGKKLFVSCVSGAILGLIFTFSADSSTVSLLADAEMQGVRGGGNCANKRCLDIECDCAGMTETCARAGSSNNCEKGVYSDFAKCGNKGSTAGYNCSSKSGTNCGVKHTGTVDQNGNCPSCPNTGPKCGQVSHICTETACP